MPIFKVDGRIVFFAHVPKCAGTSVSDHLVARFGAPAFRDRRFLSIDPDHRWTRSSPQHIDAVSLGRLFPPGFFDVIFAVVRHPVDRAVSAFHFQAEVQKTIAPDISFSAWLDDLPDELADRPFHNDNHHRPMVDLVPEEAVVFRIEDGLDRLETWLSAEFGTVPDLPRIKQENARVSRKPTFGVKPPRVVPSAADVMRIERIYAADFARFGYRIDLGQAEQKGAKPAREKPSRAKRERGAK